MSEYFWELLEIYKNPSGDESYSADKWAVMLTRGDHSHRDIMALVAQRDGFLHQLNNAINVNTEMGRELRKARKIIEVYEGHMDTYQQRMANEELKDILTEDLK